MKKYFLYAILALVGVVAVSSCEKKKFEMWYETEFDVPADAAWVKEEQAVVEKAFNDALKEKAGVEAGKFRLMAKDVTDESCDELVKEACAIAEAQIKDIKFETPFVYTIRNTTFGKIVYRYYGTGNI